MGRLRRGVWGNLTLLLAIASSAAFQQALSQIVQLGPGESSGESTTSGSVSEGPTGSTTDSIISSATSATTDSVINSGTTTDSAINTATTTTTADGGSQTVPVYQIPIEPATFSPFSVPVQSSIPGVFVNTNPSEPPPVCPHGTVISRNMLSFSLGRLEGDT